MAGSVSLSCTAVVTESSGRTITLNAGQSSSSTSQSITLTNGEVSHGVAAIATSTTNAVWDDSHPVETLEFLWIKPIGQNLILQLVTDDDGNVGEEFYTIELKAGVPFLLASEQSYANATVDFGGGTIDDIERVSIRNISGSAASYEYLIAG